MKKNVAAIALLLIANACTKSGLEGESKPQVSANPQTTNAATEKKGAASDLSAIFQPDLSTADRAVKSYWQYLDLRDRARFEYQAARVAEVDAIDKKLAAKLPLIVTGATLQTRLNELQPSRGLTLETYSREIVEVKQETESRALVMALIRNSTPPPPGATPTAADLETRDNGARLKYVVEKFQEGWKVSQTFVYDKHATIMNREPWKKLHDMGERKIYFPSYVFDHVQ